MANSLEIEEMRVMALRRTEHRLLGPALISLGLLLTYLLKSLLIFLKAGPPEIFQNSFMLGIVWYYAPTPTASAPISGTDVYSWVLLGIIFCYVLIFRSRRNRTNRLGRIRKEVFQGKLKRDLSRKK